MTMMTKKQIELFYGSEVANFLAMAISLPLDKSNPRYEVAHTVSLCVKPYTDLMLDTDAIDQDLVFIHHKSYNSAFCINLDDMTLCISFKLDPSDRDHTEIENIDFTFQTLLEKLREYYGNAQ